MSTPEVDTNTLPMEDLRKLTDAGWQGEEPNTERPRDAQGRYTSTESPDPDVDPEVPDVPEEEEVTIYRKEIDLGDGSGVQVFTGKTVDELLDKLANAQANATKKIRELNTRLKAVETAKTTETEPNPDEEFVLGQKLTTQPTKTIQQMIDTELARRETAQKTKAEREAAVAQDFMNRFPEYLPNPKNGARLIRYLETYKLDPTVDNFETAYTELNQSGLLEVRPAASEEEGVTVDTETDTDTARIEPPVERTRVTEPIQRKKAASGLSSRGTQVARPARSTEPTEEELSKMPLDKLKEFAIRDLQKF